eukprot:g7054.t1
MTPAEDGSLPFGIEAPTCGAAIEDREDVLPVAIIGAGIGGLALAVALEQAKVPFAVYERDLYFEQRKQGYGMTLTPSGLRGLGIEKACRAASQTSCRHWVLSGKEGTILGYFGRGLEGAERESEKPVAKLTFWKEEEGKEVTQYARLVVGADGIRSRVRGLDCSTNENQLSSLGVSVIVGLSHAAKSPRQEADARTVETGNRAPPAPGSASLIWDGGFYALDDRKRLFVMPYSDELTMWQLSFYDRDGSKILCGTAEPAPAAVGTATTKRTGTTPSDYLKSLALDLVADWFPLCTHLVEETANETIWGTALFDSAEDFMRPSRIQELQEGMENMQRPC